MGKTRERIWVVSKVGSNGDILIATFIFVTLALEREIVVIEGLPEIIRELKAIGNNINQLTILAHQGKIRTIDFQNFTKQVTDIYVEVCDLAKRIS